MATNVLVDTGFVVALLSRGDTNHRWAAAEAARLSPPWTTCEAVLSEAFHLLGARGTGILMAVVARGALVCPFSFREHPGSVLKLLQRYADVPMSFADACFVRMTEIVDTPVLLTTDSHFRIYRRHGRQVIPIVAPD